MKRWILTNPAFCAVTEDGRLAEYIPLDGRDRSGDILLGRVDRMMPGMDCAFVDIGRAKNGFLPLKEDSRSFLGPALRSGDRPPVQIRKEEKGEKGAFLTRDIVLAGAYVLVMPMNRHTGVSSRVQEGETRERLKETGRRIAGGRFGLVMRTAAADAGEAEIRAEAEELWQEWQEIEKAAAGAAKPGTLLRGGSAAEQLKEDYLARGLDGVRETERLEPELERQLRRAAERKVSLPGGGNIVIDRCEAMTVIDVNTASYTGSGNKAQTVLETNLEACGIIAEQVRLRNLSGIILIDFIDPASETDQSLVLERLRECFRADRVKTVIHGWTSLKLVEMTRKRTRPSLYEEMFSPCATCGGQGYELRRKD